MKFGVFVHPKRPKIAVDKIAKKLHAAKVQLSQRDPDIGIVVGGDGSFGYYGRTLDIPMLFVGVHEPYVLGSQSRLAEIFYDDLGRTLKYIEYGRYNISEKTMISVNINDNSADDILTDVYLERGIFSGCLRYLTSVDIDNNSNRISSSFTEFAIGNGVIASSSFGSGGYFSYIDRLDRRKQDKNSAPSFPNSEIGICHILPVYLLRKKNNKKKNTRAIKKYKIRYTIPFHHSSVRIKLVRDADARLYGTTLHSRGIKVNPSDEILITGSTRTAKIIKLRTTII